MVQQLVLIIFLTKASIILSDANVLYITNSRDTPSRYLRQVPYPLLGEGTRKSNMSPIDSSSLLKSFSLARFSFLQYPNISSWSPYWLVRRSLQVLDDIKDVSENDAFHNVSQSGKEVNSRIGSLAMRDYLDGKHVSWTKQILLHKFLSLLFMVFISIMGFLTPCYFEKISESQKWMCFIRNFALGTFLGLTFFHLIPEVIEISTSLSFGFKINNQWFNLMHPFILLGYLFIFVLEKIIGPALIRGVSQREFLSRCQDANVVVCFHDCILPKPISHEPLANDYGSVVNATQASLPEKDGKSAERPHGGTMEYSRKKRDVFSSLNDPLEGAAMDREKQGLPFSDSFTNFFWESTRFSSSFFMCLFVCFALCFHSISEGILIGLISDALTVWITTFSVCAHKWAFSMALATNCLTKKLSKRSTVMILTIFALSSPIGVIVGILGSVHNSIIYAIINTTNLGIIIYAANEMAFSEFQHFASLYNAIQKVAYLVIGALIVLGFTFISALSTPHLHSH